MIGAGRFDDVYVFDYRMGDMDAPDFCNYIRETDSSTPILIFSAMPQQLYKDLAFSSGVNGLSRKAERPGNFAFNSRIVIGRGGGW